MVKVKQKSINKKLEKRLTISHAIKVHKYVTMRETVNAPHRQISNRMHKYYGIQSKENI